MNGIRSERERLQDLIWKAGLWFDVVAIKQHNGNLIVVIVTPARGKGHELQLRGLMADQNYAVEFSSGR